jgi:hypothetical protein
MNLKPGTLFFVKRKHFLDSHTEYSSVCFEIGEISMFIRNCPKEGWTFLSGRGEIAFLIHDYNHNSSNSDTQIESYIDFYFEKI